MNDYAHYGLGVCRLRAGDRTGARAHLRLATVMRPDNDDYRRALAEATDEQPGGTGVADVSEPSAVVCCDLDGVVWRGDEPIPGSADAVAALERAGLRVVFLTNNSSGRVEDYVGKLAAIGSRRRPRRRRASAQAAASVLAAHARARRARCSRVPARESSRRWTRAASTSSIRARPTRSSSAFIATSTSTRLTRAADAVRAGARFVATNLDPTYPVPGGLVPGAGALVAAVATAAGA